MDSSFDVSFNASALLEDHQLDTTDLLMPEEEYEGTSPVKKLNHKTNSPFQSLKSVSLPNLACSFSSPSNELFQVTTHLRQDKNLHNGKIQKLLQSLQGENSDYELDDQLRTRVFKARAARNSSLDALDMHLDSWLQEADPKRPPSPSKRRSLSAGLDADKENAVLEPSKRKLSDSVRKPPLKKTKSYASIPLLQSKRDTNSWMSSVQTSPQRVCVPKPTASPGKPCLKAQENIRIFLVDSSTGSVADATQFGTELNASNCEGFPLPDNANEVVQIPTNDTGGSSAVQKMAFIKVSAGKSRESAEKKHSHKGFYSRQEFEDLRARSRTVAIFQDSGKRVRWADELEW
ncbi:hypothetical protein OXX79_000342 [Metschnikowia pulcherrima]